MCISDEKCVLASFSVAKLSPAFLLPSVKKIKKERKSKRAGVFFSLKEAPASPEGDAKRRNVSRNSRKLKRITGHWVIVRLYGVPCLCYMTRADCI